MMERNTVILLATLAMVAIMVLVGYLVRRMIERRSYFDALYGLECENLYFHGYKLSRYLSTATFNRFSQWLDSSEMSNILAVLMMILLKDEPTAVLCQGRILEKYNYKRSHSWVEFRVPLNGTWIIDFLQEEKCFYRKREHEKILKATGFEFVIGNEIKYDEFWEDLPLADIVRDKMAIPETSYLLSVLELFMSFFDDKRWIGIRDVAYHPEHYYSKREIAWLGTFTVPFYCGGEIISTEILLDFLRRETRMQPKERTKRVAISEKKYYDEKIKERRKAAVEQSNAGQKDKMQDPVPVKKIQDPVPAKKIQDSVSPPYVF